jgi:predicted DNA binding protein
MDPHLERAPFGALVVAPDGTVSDANDRATTLLGTDADTLRDTAVTAAMPATTADDLDRAFADGPTPASFEEYYPSIDRWLAVDVVPAGERTLVYLRDRTDAREQASELDRLRRRVDRIEAVDALTARTLQTVIDADDREAVARTVCEGLGTTERYAFAWVGETDPAGDGLRVVASAGDTPDLTDSLRARLDTPPTPGDAGQRADDQSTDPEDTRAAATADRPTLIEWRAVQTGSTVTTERLAADRSVPEAVRSVAFGRGLQSAIAVPLAHGDTVFGVLGVYLARENGLGESERSSLETLGAVAGHAITASRREDLLYADTVTELTLRVADDRLPLAVAARAADAPLSLAGVVPRSTGADPSATETTPTVTAADADADAVAPPEDGTAEVAVCYSHTAGDPEAAVDALAAEPDAAAPRTVDGDQRTLLEVSLVGQTPLSVLAELGATVEDGTADATGYDLTVAVPTEVSAREPVAAVDAVAAEVTVRSKTERRPTDRSEATFREDLASSLTERQHTVLRTAYLAEYFASPRGSSAEELADALDITGPTVLYHLRRAQRKLLDAFFTEDDPDAEVGPDLADVPGDDA